MSIVLMPTSELEYVPKYLFMSDEKQPGTYKSHVMKEFLRKRNTIRRQKQLATRSQSRVLPWLRREDMKPQPQPSEVPAEDTGASPESSYASSSAVTSPQAFQWTNGSIATESFSSTAFSTSSSTGPVHGMAKSATLDGSSEICHEHWDLLDYLFRNVLGQLSETCHFNNMAWPGSTMARYTLERKLPSQALLATSSLCRDFDAGHQQPTSATIALMLGGIQLLKEQLHKPDGINGDSILTMTNLWMYEAVLGFDIADDVTIQSTRANTAASLQSVQAHIDGLRRSITHMGGLKYLPPEAMWSVAWCVGSLPGYWTETRVTGGPSSGKACMDPGYRCSLTRLVDFLARIERLASSADSQPSILQETTFSLMRHSLLRLVRTATNQRTALKSMMRSTSMLSILLFAFDILLRGSNTNVQTPRNRQKEMMRLQDRLEQHNIDKEGSPQKAWQILMTEKEVPHVQLHPRAWPIVEMVNEIKHLNVSTIDSLSKLLTEWMFPQECERIEEFRYERLVLQIHFELDGFRNVR